MHDILHVTDMRYGPVHSGGKIKLWFTSGGTIDSFSTLEGPFDNCMFRSHVQIPFVCAEPSIRSAYSPLSNVSIIRWLATRPILENNWPID